MKILIVSDSHGDVNPMIKAIKSQNPDLILHLGDNYDDALELKRHFDTQIKMVKGNCDFNHGAKDIEIFDVEKIKILMCHGHQFSVKSTVNSLYNHAKTVRCDIALFGHTHIDYHEERNGVHLFNPGSISRSLTPSYAILTANDGKFEFGTLYV